MNLAARAPAGVEARFGVCCIGECAQRAGVMTAPDPIHASPASPTALGRLFPGTRWDLVAQAGEGGGLRDAALNELCRLYWYPVYAYLRRHGYRVIAVG